MYDMKSLCALLEREQISYELYPHPAAYTIEEMDALNLPHAELVAKNLFLRDDKKRNYYLVTLPGHKSVDLKRLSQQIPSRKLSFAGEDKLLALLHLEKGHVTPFGALNDGEKAVTVVFDACLQGTVLGVHPMENTATVFLAFEDLYQLLARSGVKVVICDLDES